MSRDNGGQMFPQSPETSNVGAVYGGLTLRQWYAGQALVGLLTDTEENSNVKENADFCFRQADEMIERSKT